MGMPKPSSRVALLLQAQDAHTGHVSLPTTSAEEGRQKPPLPPSPHLTPSSHPGSSPRAQLSRLMQRNGLSQEEAEARIRSQLPLDEKRRFATHIVDNSGERESTRRQVLRLHTQLEDSLDFLWARLAAGTVVAGLGGLLYLLLRHFSS